MSDQTATPTAEPAAPTAAPDTNEDMGFLEALDAKIGDPNSPRPAPEPTPTPNTDTTGDAGGDSTKKKEDKSSKEPSLDDLDPSKIISGGNASSDEDATKSDILDGLDVDPDTQSWTPEAAHAFKTVKGQLKELKPKLTELEQTLAEKEARIKELDASASDSKLEEMQQRIDDYEKRLLVTDLESSSVYQEQIAQPIEQLANEVNEFAAQHNLSAREISEAINMNDPAAQDERLGELLAGIGDRQKKRIYDVIDGMDVLMSRRATIMENAEQAAAEAKALEEEREKSTSAERARERRKAATQVSEKVAEKLPFLSEIEGLDLKQIAEEVSTIDPTALDAVKHSYHAISAKLLPHLAKRLVIAEKEHAAVLEQLAAYKSSSPSAGGPSGGAVSGSTGDEEISMLDAINRRLGS